MHRHKLISLAFVSALSLPLLFQGGLLQPDTAAGATITCSAGLSGCHFSPSVTDGTGRNVPSGQFPGSHAKHSGAAANQYAYACTQCHPSGSYTNSHQTGYKNITGSSLPGTSYNQGKKIQLSFQNNPTFGTCSNVYCHSTVQGTNGVGAWTSQVPAPTWGGLSLNCGSCHVDMSTASGTGTHPKHAGSAAGQYGMACSSCHTGYTSNSVNVTAHSNNTIEVALASGSYNGGTTPGNHAPGGGYGSCSSNSCHTDGKAAPTFVTATWGGSGGCATCHKAQDTYANMGAAATPLTAAHNKHVATDRYGLNTSYHCGACHADTATNNTTVNVAGGKHVNATRDWKFGTFGGWNQSAGSYAASSCTATYCHSKGVSTTAPFTAPITNILWTAGAGSSNCTTTCHGGNATAATIATNGPVDKHSKHIATDAYNMTCDECHAETTAAASSTTLNATTGYTKHVNGTKDYKFSAAFRGTAYSEATGTYAGAGGACANTYCHSRGTIMATAPNASTYTGNHAPFQSATWAGSLTNCNGCHGDATYTNGMPNYTNGTPKANSHLKHVGFTCEKCHYLVTTNGTSIANFTQHVDGNYDVSNQAGTITYAMGTLTGGIPAGGTCSTTYCHSKVQSASGGARVAGDYQNVTWGGAAMTCASCHGNTDTTLLTGTHAKHLNAAYGYTCATCHGVAGGAGNTAIHANGTINYDLTAKGTNATYNGDNTPANGGFGTCSATVCHGTNSGAWGTSVSNQLCTECHGQVNTAYGNFSSSIIAPGGSGVDTGGNSAATSARVGAHQTHLLAQSNISDKVHCGECHTVHVAINEGTHLNYTTSTITFGATAKAQSHTPTIARSSGVITCSTTYCHTGKSNTGSAMAPTWNDTNYLTATTNLVMADCKKCHNMPPATADHTGITNLTGFPAATCSCHTNMSGSATTVAAIFTDKNLHVNGTINVTVDCLSCHGSSRTKTKPSAGTIRPVTGAGNDFVRLSRHVSNGTSTEIVTKWDCIVCHRAGDATSATGATDTANHGNDSGTGLVQLRNVDSPNSGWAINNKSMDETMRTNMDTFCLNCHDSDGAKGISVNAANSGLNYDTTGGTVARNTTPFNTNDNLRNGRDGLTGRTRVLDVKSQFNPGSGGTGTGYNGNPSQHAVLGGRYSANNASWTSVAWTAHTLRNGTNMQTIREKATLHCSDCHLSEANAHGAANAWFMLLNGVANDYTSDATNQGSSLAAVGTSITTCYKCHSSTTYGASGGAPSRFSHSNDSGNILSTKESAALGVQCMFCHGGDNYGNIHGVSGTYTPGQAFPPAGSTYTRYRFLPGAWMQYKPGTGGTDADFNSTTAGTCYFPAAGNSMASCTSHSGGTKNPSSTVYARPVKY